MGSVLCLGKAIAVAAALLCGWKNGLKIRDLSRFCQQGPHPLPGRLSLPQPQAGQEPPRHAPKLGSWGLQPRRDTTAAPEEAQGGRQQQQLARI